VCLPPHCPTLPGPPERPVAAAQVLAARVLAARVRLAQ
jgi:hypothetical protein